MSAFLGGYRGYYKFQTSIYISNETVQSLGEAQADAAVGAPKARKP